MPSHCALRAFPPANDWPWPSVDQRASQPSLLFERNRRMQAAASESVMTEVWILNASLSQDSTVALVSKSRTCEVVTSQRDFAIAVLKMTNPPLTACGLRAVERKKRDMSAPVLKELLAPSRLGAREGNLTNELRPERATNQSVRILSATRFRFGLAEEFRLPLPCGRVPPRADIAVPISFFHCFHASTCLPAVAWCSRRAGNIHQLHWRVNASGDVFCGGRSQPKRWAFRTDDLAQGCSTGECRCDVVTGSSSYR